MLQSIRLVIITGYVQTSCCEEEESKVKGNRKQDCFIIFGSETSKLKKQIITFFDVEVKLVCKEIFRIWKTRQLSKFCTTEWVFDYTLSAMLKPRRLYADLLCSKQQCTKQSSWFHWVFTLGWMLLLLHDLKNLQWFMDCVTESVRTFCFASGNIYN